MTDAEINLRSTAAKDAAKGCTANGRLKMIDPMTNPSNVKASVCPVMDCHQRPMGLREPSATSRKKPSTVGGSTSGSATSASIRNFQRQRE